MPNRNCNCTLQEPPSPAEFIPLQVCTHCTKINQLEEHILNQLANTYTNNTGHAFASGEQYSPVVVNFVCEMFRAKGWIVNVCFEQRWRFTFNREAG